MYAESKKFCLRREFSLCLITAPHQHSLTLSKMVESLTFTPEDDSAPSVPAMMALDEFSLLPGLFSAI